MPKLFSQMEAVSHRFEELSIRLNQPETAADPALFRRLMQEYHELEPVVDAYRKLATAKDHLEQAKALLEGETLDADFKEMVQQEVSEKSQDVAELENNLKILLLPKDANDEKSVILELRGGAGKGIGLPAVQGDHLHRSPGQPFVGRQHIAVLGVDDGVLHRCAADENVVNGGKHRPLIHAKARGGVALGVKVAHQDLCPGLLQAGGQVHAAGGFPHPAFLVDKGDGFGHGFPSFPEPCGSCELVTG